MPSAQGIGVLQSCKECKLAACGLEVDYRRHFRMYGLFIIRQYCPGNTRKQRGRGGLLNWGRFNFHNAWCPYGTLPQDKLSGKHKMIYCNSQPMLQASIEIVQGFSAYLYRKLLGLLSWCRGKACRRSTGQRLVFQRNCCTTRWCPRHIICQTSSAVGQVQPLLSPASVCGPRLQSIVQKFLKKSSTARRLSCF